MPGQPGKDCWGTGMLWRRTFSDAASARLPPTSGPAAPASSACPRRPPCGRRRGCPPDPGPTPGSPPQSRLHHNTHTGHNTEPRRPLVETHARPLLSHRICNGLGFESAPGFGFCSATAYLMRVQTCVPVSQRAYTTLLILDLQPHLDVGAERGATLRSGERSERKDKQTSPSRFLALSDLRTPGTPRTSATPRRSRSRTRRSRCGQRKGFWEVRA